MPAVNGHANKTVNTRSANSGDTVIREYDQHTLIFSEKTLIQAKEPISSATAHTDEDCAMIVQDQLTRIFNISAHQANYPATDNNYTIIGASVNHNDSTVFSPFSDHTIIAVDDKTRILHAPPNLNSSLKLSAPNEALFDEAAYSEASNESLTHFDSTKHSNSLGILAAREVFEKALKSKGKVLNKRFVLESVLGFGGMGVVYLTKDLRRVEAEDPFPYIATKVLNDDFKDHPDAFVALQQEAVKSQLLSHPNIVTVHDFDRDGNTLYMTMELLRGNPLDKLIKRNYEHGMPNDEAIAIFDGLCDGLSCAHRNKLIHSDFKPMNVFLTFGQVAKILDFGIARVCSDNAVNLSKFDAGNLGALTPEYASLEMIQKKAPHFSDDIYALACVFYLTLTGKHPYNKVPANKALRKKMKPERIKSLSPTQWQALEKGLALEQKNRFQTVDEFNRAFHAQARLKTAHLVGLGVSLISMGLLAMTLV
ncbi:MAG: serine/threonine protein kinase [Oleiphilus sp.]